MHKGCRRRVNDSYSYIKIRASLFTERWISHAQTLRNIMKNLEVTIQREYNDGTYLAAIIIGDLIINGVRIQKLGKDGKPWINMPAYRNKSGFIKAVRIADDSVLNGSIKEECLKAIELFNENLVETYEDLSKEEINNLIDALPYS